MALDTYLNYLQENGRSKEYISKQKRVLNATLGDLQDTQEHLDMLAERATQATVNDYYNRIKCYGLWLDGGESFKGLKKPVANKVSKDKATFTKAEVKKLINSEEVSPKNRALWLILSHTGLRPVEASRVNPDHLVKNGDSWFLVLPSNQQKSKRPDPIGLTEREANLIKKYCPLIDGDYKKLYRVLRSDLKKAGIPVKQNGVARTPYNLRSFMITELLRNNVDLETVRILARHSDIKTTLTHYARFNQGEVAKTRMKLINL